MKQSTITLLIVLLLIAGGIVAFNWNTFRPRTVESRLTEPVVEDLPYLIDSLKTNQGDSANQIQIIAAIQQLEEEATEAVPALAQLSRSDVIEVQKASIAALKSIGKPALVRLLEAEGLNTQMMSAQALVSAFESDAVFCLKSCFDPLNENRSLWLYGA